MNKQKIFSHSFLIFFIIIWLASIINVILKIYSNRFLGSSSVPVFAAYYGLLYWIIVFAAAGTSFFIGLQKIGIIDTLRIKILVKNKGYDPEIYVAFPKSQPVLSISKSSENEKLLTIENNSKTIISPAEPKINQKDQNKNKDQMKAFYLFGKTEFEKCSHKLGYLGKKLKNKPIPDECFGCPEILDCFKSDTETNKKKKPILTTTL